MSDNLVMRLENRPRGTFVRMLNLMVSSEAQSNEIILPNEHGVHILLSHH